MAKKQAKTP